MSKGSGWGSVSQVISRDINSLHRSDGPLVGGGDPLLHAAHVSGLGGLVPHSRGNTAQQGRDLRPSLRLTIEKILTTIGEIT